MLFGRKKKEKATADVEYILSLYDGDMRALYCDCIQRFPLPESLVLACSEEFFNDPAPCEIHRRAVAMRLYGEIIEATPIERTIACADVPPRISLCLRDVNPAFMRLEAKQRTQ